MVRLQPWKIPTHERLKRTLFIRTKHSTRIFGVIPFIKLSNDIWTADKRWKMRCRTRTLIFFWLSCVVFVSSSFQKTGWAMLFSCPVPRRLAELCCFPVQFPEDWLSYAVFLSSSQKTGWSMLFSCPVPRRLAELCCFPVQFSEDWPNYVVFSVQCSSPVLRRPWIVWALESKTT